MGGPVLDMAEVSDLVADTDERPIRLRRYRPDITAMEAGKSIMLVAQKNGSKDDPTASDIYGIGCVSNILQLLKLPDGTVKVLIEGVSRARIANVDTEGSFRSCRMLETQPMP